MTSAFGWLDTDRSQRQHMLELVEQFREQGTVDDLGIGQIRDSFSDVLFPGTSTLHTRLRYALFIPWLLQRASKEGNSQEMVEEMRRLEFRLIDSLKRGDAGEGIIGVSAGRQLRRLPSSIYWSLIGTWGIRTREYSPGEFFTVEARIQDMYANNPASDDPESRALPVDSGLDPQLPAMPADLLTRATFDLDAQEADYISHRITSSAPTSVLAWLVHNPPPTQITDINNLWEVPNLDNAPAANLNLIDHAQRFSRAIYGANLTYNLLLARESGREELLTRYTFEIDQWRAEIREHGTMRGWDRTEFWGHITRQRTIPGRTRIFIDTWLDHTASGGDPVTDTRVHTLITSREWQLKRGRARLTNRSALDQWSGSVGLGRLNYRWSFVRTLLDDLYRGRES